MGSSPGAGGVTVIHGGAAQLPCPVPAAMALLTAAVAALAAVPAQAPVQLPDDGIGTPAPPAHPHTSPGCRDVGKPGWRLGAGALMGLGPPGQRRAGPRQTKLPAWLVGTRRCGSAAPSPPENPGHPPPAPQAEGTQVPGQPAPRPGVTGTGGFLRANNSPATNPEGTWGRAGPKRDSASPLSHGGGGTGGAEPHSRPSRRWHRPHALAGISTNGIYHFIQYSPKDEPGKGGAPPLPPASPPRSAKLFLIKTSPGLSITVPLHGTPAPGGLRKKSRGAALHKTCLISKGGPGVTHHLRRVGGASTHVPGRGRAAATRHTKHRPGV